VENIDIARLLEEVADLLEIQGANPFRVRAYRNAVRTVEAQTTPFAKMVAEGRELTELPGIGKEMAGHVGELVETGALAVRDALLAEVPRGLLDLMRLPNVGPKRARKLWEALAVESVDDLEAAARAGQVAAVAGFGAKSQEKILAGIADFRQHQGRMRLADADAHVEPLLAHLRAAPELVRLEVAGSYRRRRETVGDIDLLAIAAPADNAAERLVERFTAYPQVERVLAACAERGVAVELNALPERLDLKDTHLMLARDLGVKVVISTDAHSVRDLALMRYGVEQARRAWLEPKHVLNTLPLAKFFAALGR
jgi:DNA polymerase (family X)